MDLIELCGTILDESIEFDLKGYLAFWLNLNDLLDSQNGLQLLKC